MNETPTIGDRLREARRARQMPLHAVARQLGVSVATLSRIETNKQSIDLPLFVEIAHALGVDPASLIQNGWAARSGEDLARELASMQPAERAKIFAAATRGAHRGKRKVDLQQQLDGLLSALDVLRTELVDIRRRVGRKR